jgi:hypothetical protein
MQKTSGNDKSEGKPDGPYGRALPENIRAKEARMEGFGFFIPDNDFGIPEGRCSQRDLVALLRERCEEPECIYFIADMME